MTQDSLLMKKPIPSLAEWLGDGVRADGFEEWVRTVIYAEKTVAEDEAEASSLRMLKTLLVAFVEMGRVETNTHGRAAGEVAGMMARISGAAVMAATMSICRDDTPYMRIARIMADDFESGAKSIVKASKAA